MTSKILSIIAIGLALSSKSQALMIEPQASYTFANKYALKGTDVDYETKGVLFGLNFLFNLGDMVIEDAAPYMWGLGVDFGSMKGEINDQALVAGTIGPEIKYNSISPYLIFSMHFTDIRMRIYASPFTILRETFGVTNGDEKYGFGAKFELGYRVFSSLYVHAGYSVNSYDRGKNKSTGQSGSLTNKIHWQYAYVGLSFPFTFSNMFNFYSPPENRTSGARRPR